MSVSWSTCRRSLRSVATRAPPATLRRDIRRREAPNNLPPVTTGGTASRGHRADIQGLRAVAVLLVVLFHAELGFSGGFVGVDVFFVISGFVITNLLTRELDATGGLRFGRFYLRRIRRLVPALALVLVGAGLLAILAAPVGVQPIAARTGA